MQHKHSLYGRKSSHISFSHCAKKCPSWFVPHSITVQKLFPQPSPRDSSDMCIMFRYMYRYNGDNKKDMLYILAGYQFPFREVLKTTPHNRHYYYNVKWFIYRWLFIL